MDLSSYVLDYDDKLRKNSKIQKIKKNQYYQVSCFAKSIAKKKYSAYFALIFLDKNKKELLRRVRWFDNCSKEMKKYHISCRSDPRSEYACVGYRANVDGTEKTEQNLDLSSINKINILPTDIQQENYDELYDYTLIWSRRKNLQSNDWDRAGQTKEQFEQGKKVNYKQLQIIGFTDHSEILDIGCGLGRLPATIIDFFDFKGNYYGIDVGQESIDFCKKYYNKNNFFFMKNEGSEIPFTNKKFDFITFFSVFTHLYPDEIRKFLRNCKNLIREHGFIIADIFELKDIEKFTGTRGMMLYNLEYFSNLIKSEGFVLEEIPEFSKNITKWPGADRRVLYRISPTKN